MAEPAYIEGLTVRLGAFSLKHVDLEVEPGQILVILGPNGAGKSVTLEAIAGFHRLEAGRIRFGERDVTALAPEHRNVGLLFQDFSLFPHLSVAQNIALGLKARPKVAQSIVSAVPHRDLSGLMAYFGIAHLAERSPDTLSPGEKQRTALARGMATAPDLFLFDEPFSAIDMRTRGQLCADLGRFLHAARTPAIFVTHDQADAFAMADKIAIMRAGQIVQSGPPATIFKTPVNHFVADFLGVENLLAGRFDGVMDGLQVFSVGDQRLYAAADGNQRTEPRDVLLCIRAGDVDVDPSPGERAMGGSNLLSGRITALASLGALARLTLDCGFPLQAYVLAREVRERALALGNRVSIEIRADAIHAIERPSPDERMRAVS